MSDIKWIKLSINVFDDEKFDAIKTLPDSNDIQLAWIKLLCLAGKCNESGFLMLTREIPYTNEMLASRFGMDVGVVQRALAIFQKLDMVDVIDNVYLVSNWTKYQSLDAYERKKEYDREYRQKKREEQKALLEGKDKKSYDSRTTNRKKSADFVLNLNLNSNNLTSESDIDTVNIIDTTENTNKDNTKHKVFIVPTVEEVTEYCKDKSLIYVNPEAFIDFYESKNWMIGKNKMSSWKSAVSGWNRRAMERGDKPYKSKTGTPYRQKPKPEPEDDGRIPLEEYLKINPNI